jgi:plasmid stabilization system protein ParE
VRYQVQFSATAVAHVDRITAWYAAEAPEQVARFIECLAKAKVRMAAYPYLGRPVTSDLRRLPMKVFPYQLWYVVEDRTATVVAVTHFRQDTTAILRDRPPA